MAKQERLREAKQHGAAWFPFNIYPCTIPKDFPQVALHWQDSMELVFVKKGRGIVQAGLTTYTAQAGDIYVFAPGVLHALRQLPGEAMEYENIIFELELLGGVTTIRTVGGIADFDTRCRDDAAAGKLLAPRILAANEGISVPGGHMAGSVAVAAHNNAEALAQLRRAGEQRVDLVKLMITGGVLDATQKGTPGELKMKPEMVRAVCDEAHRLGYPVAAHTESPEGVKVALENGVDSIEHGAKMDEETIRLYKERGAFVCTTISPALPYALFDPAISGASEKDQYNGRIVFDGVVESARTALANGIPVGLGNDVGCPYVTQYDFWRELCYFHKYCGVSNQFALHTATLRNARLAGVGDVTGSIEAGKSADFIVTRKNPLDDLAALRQLELVVCRGRAVHKPAPKRNKTVDALLDPYLV